MKDQLGLKEFMVTYKSKYFPLEGTRKKYIKATSKKSIRDNWHGIVGTDEYKITNIIEKQKTPLMNGGNR